MTIYEYFEPVIPQYFDPMLSKVLKVQEEAQS